MFPEGTRRSGPEVGELRDGVAYLSLRTGAPVVPVGIGGSERAMPRGASFPRPKRVTLVIGPPVAVPAGAGEETTTLAPSTAGEDPPGTRRRARLGRSAITEHSERLRAAIQQAFDAAAASLSR